MKNIFILILSLVLVTTSCDNKSNDPTPEPPEPLEQFLGSWNFESLTLQNGSVYTESDCQIFSSENSGKGIYDNRLSDLIVSTNFGKFNIKYFRICLGNETSNYVIYFEDNLIKVFESVIYNPEGNVPYVTYDPTYISSNTVELKVTQLYNPDKSIFGILNSTLRLTK